MSICGNLFSSQADLAVELIVHEARQIFKAPTKKYSDFLTTLTNELRNLISDSQNCEIVEYRGPLKSRYVYYAVVTDEGISAHFKVQSALTSNLEPYLTIANYRLPRPHFTEVWARENRMVTRHLFSEIDRTEQDQSRKFFGDDWPAHQ